MSLERHSFCILLYMYFFRIQHHGTSFSGLGGDELMVGLDLGGLLFMVFMILWTTWTLESDGRVILQSNPVEG